MNKVTHGVKTVPNSVIVEIVAQVYLPLAWVFVANGNGIAGLRVVVSSRGVPALQPVWQTSSGGTSPLVANNVLYYASSAGIRALNPFNGQQLWGDPSVSSFHWESPIVANGVLYITDENSHLTAYTVG